MNHPNAQSGQPTQTLQFKHHVKRHWPKLVSSLIFLLLVSAGFAWFARPETKPSSATATTYADMFGVGGFSGLGQLTEFPASLRQAGVKTIRVPMSWSTEQPNGAADPINNFDEFAQLARANGIRVLGVLAYTPSWARTDACERQNPGAAQQCEPRNAAEYGAWVGKMGRHYKQFGIQDWEIWNEPNHAGFWKSERPANESINPNKYANMVMSAWTEIKKAENDPAARLIIGATSPSGEYTPEPEGRSIEPRSFIKQVYETAKNQNRNLSDYYTALSHHPYTWSGGTNPGTNPNFENLESWTMMYQNIDTNATPTNQSDDTTFACPTVSDRATLTQRFNALNTLPEKRRPSLRCIMEVYGASSKKIWVTEYGSPTGTYHFKSDNGGRSYRAGNIVRSYTDDVQIRFIREAMSKWKDYAWAGNFYVFRWADGVPFTVPPMEATNPDTQVRQGILKRKVNPALADNAPANAYGCNGTDNLNPTGRAKKTYCWLKNKLDDPLGSAPSTQGLRGRYYGNKTFSGTPQERTDATVNFVWGPGRPTANVPTNDFSVRWVGKIKSGAAGTYRFRTNSDDGVRVWIGGTKIIDNWDTHAPEYNTAAVTLTANTDYTIRIDYYDEQYGATMQFEWDQPGGGRSDFQVVPSTQLRTPRS